MDFMAQAIELVQAELFASGYTLEEAMAYSPSMVRYICKWAAEEVGENEEEVFTALVA